MYPLDDTIAAIASPPGGAARGILRLSGPEAIACVARFFRAASERPLCDAAARSVITGWLELPGLHSPLPCEAYVWTGERGEGRGERHEAISASNPQSLIPNPFPSYTGQPVVEIHTIGSPPLLELALRSFCGAGARLAGPGEFTLRAFLSGRIDLGQAEAVLGVIDAVDRRDLEIALAQLAGGLAHPVQRLHDALLELLAELEAGFDFPDESAAFVTPEQLGARLDDARRQIDGLLAQMAGRGAAGSGPPVILVGRPNAGKSSLFNALAGGPAALVSAQAGTTRDYLTAELDLGGIKCQLIDTAGEREAGGRPNPNPLPKGEGTYNLPSPACGRGARGEGNMLPSPACGRGAGGEGWPPSDYDSLSCSTTIEQAAQTIASDQRRLADIEMVCIDSTCTPNDSQLEQLRTRDARTIVVVTKWDESERAAFWRKESRDMEVCFVSSRTGEGLAELKGELRRRLAALRFGRGEVVGATAARCHESLRIAGECIDRARQVALAGQEEFVAAELRVALEELGRVTGAVYTDDVLDRIFSRFCIGK